MCAMMGDMRTVQPFFGAMALFLLTLIYRIDTGAMGFRPPVIIVGYTCAGAANNLGETFGIQRGRPLGSTAPFGHPNDEFIEVAFQEFETTFSQDDESTSAAPDSFFFTDFSSSTRGFVSQGPNFLENQAQITEPDIIAEPNAFPGLETAETIVTATELTGDSASMETSKNGETPPNVQRDEAASGDSYELVAIDEVRIPSFAMPGACPPAVPMPEIPTSIKKMLRGANWTAPLAQIATAYQPGLKLENIREISVGTVDETHLDLEALVCEDDSGRCVMVEVPVDFPTSCFGAENASQCILDNIQQLYDFIKAEEESELFLTDKILLERERLLKEVVSPKFIEYPNWWSTPIVLAGECNTLRLVLNEAECQPQLQRLFRRNSAKAWKIVRAALVAVGPCGVILRALDTKNQLHEVPIEFSVPATDAGRLRAAVLELFG